LYYAQIFEFLEVLDQSVVGQVRSIEDSRRFCFIALPLNDSHYVYVDSELRAVLGRWFRLGLFGGDHNGWFTLRSIAKSRRNPNSCAIWASAKKTGAENVKNRKNRCAITSDTNAPKTNDEIADLLTL